MSSTIDSTAEGSNAPKTAAQLLMEKHEAHPVTVEDVPDEDDIQHPVPSHGTSTPAANGTSNGTLSEKAAGKRKEGPPSRGLDTQSEEAFPSLGPKPSAVKAPGWGPKGASPVTAPPSSSGYPTPNSTPGVQTPTSNRPAPATNRGTAGVNLPGKYQDSFEIAIADIDKDKSIERVLQEVRRKYKVAVRSEDAGFSTRRRFIAEGLRQQVTDALMQISKEISVEQKLKIEVPATVSATIIGKGGANIRQLEQQFQVKIRIERDSRPPSTGPDDPRVDLVEIKGHSAAVRLAHDKIAGMVKQLQPRVDLPVRNIPPEFYPFLQGRHADHISQLEQDRDLRIQIPQFHTWSAQPPPRPEREDRPPAFVPHGDDFIIISGDQAAAVQARQQIEQIAQQLQQELLLQELTAEQILHPYIVGDRGMDPVKFLQETGCAVILPPPHHETDDIHIIGPADKIEAGKDLATRLMAQKHNRTVDLQKQFADARQGRALARYLQQKAIEREFKNAHNAEIVFPSQANAGQTWTVITDDPQKAVTARNDLAKITQAFPTQRLSLVDVDPFFHQHLHRMHAEDLRQQHGVHLIIPDDDDDAVVLVYEGPEQDGPFAFPRVRPSNNEQKEFERALKAAQQQLLGSIPSQNVLSQDMEVPRKFHNRVRRFVDNEQKPQSASQFPVEVNYGGPRPTRQRKNNAGNADQIFFRGPSDGDIAELRRKIEEFLIEAEQDEKERGYVTYCDFPQKFVKNLVGKQGANIKALRDKYDVEIDTKEPGKVKIQGPQKKAEACKAEIIKLGKQYEDEVNYIVKVEPRFHGELIGKNGENLHKMQGKVNNEVRIDFPKVARANDDAATDAGDTTRQAADEIRIRGPRAKADKIRDELLNLHQYLKDNSHTAEVSVARDQIASLIGRGGSEMERLRAETGAQIDVPNRKGEGDSDRVVVSIKGTKQQVEKAKVELQKRSKAFDAVVTKTINVDRNHHRAIIGSGGANIRRIVVDAGGPEQSAEAVRFPRQGEDSNELVIKGLAEVVNKIIASIQEFVDEKENSVSETIDVPVEQHRTLIGANGSNRRQIEEQYKISLDIPRRESGKTGVKISGQPSNVAMAKEHIASLTKQTEGITINVPRAVHHTVSKNGLLFRELNRDGIKVDHSGHKPPAKPLGGNAQRARTTNGDMPLITDPQAGQSFSFDIVQSSGGNEDGESGTIPWVLFGNKDTSDEAIAKAQKSIETAIERANEPKWTGYMILPDPRAHRHVIGRGGATINRIRKNTGCDIQVPKNQTGDEAITIVGDQDAVAKARDAIWEEVQKAGEF